MPVYEFSLILDKDPQFHLDELAEAGCDDAEFGTQSRLGFKDGYYYADFSRVAPSYEAARDSAVQALEALGLGVLAIIDNPNR